MQMNFQDAIETSDSLIKRLESGTVSKEEFCQAMADLLPNLASARGFFVSTLTGDWNFDQHVDLISRIIEGEPGQARDLLVKNLVMSSATAVSHSRSADEKAQAGSQRVIHRSRRLIQKLPTGLLATPLSNMQEALEHALEGKAPVKPAVADLTDFLNKWKYDREQLETALGAIKALSAQPCEPPVER